MIKPKQVFVLYILLSQFHFSNASKIKVDFFCQELLFDVEVNSVQDISVSNDLTLQTELAKINSKIFSNFLKQIKGYRNEFNLNDWFTYLLIKGSVETIFSHNSEDTQTFYSWYFLSELGYRCAINYGAVLELFVYSEGPAFGLQKYRNYYRLSDKSVNEKSKVSMSDISRKGRPFSFKLHRLPELDCSEPFQRFYNVYFKNQKYRFELEINLNHIRLMENYPQVNTVDYFNIPLSGGLYNSIIPQLKGTVKGMNNFDAVRFMLSFVRQNFIYKDDWEYYESEKPMIAEEALFYDVNDCEDRSVLFYMLVKEVLNLPVVVLDYPNHLNIGVALNESYGKEITHEGVTFAICEPTNPEDNLVIGEMLEKGLPKVIHYYQGK